MHLGTQRYTSHSFYKVYSHRYPGTKNRLRIVQIEGDLSTQIVTIDFHQSAWVENVGGKFRLDNRIQR